MIKAKLKLLGRVPNSVQAQYAHLFRQNENDVSFFCDFSAFNIPLETVFTTIEDMKGSDLFIGKAIIKFVTQGFSLRYDMIPMGHKTISTFHFIDLPKILQRLPVISDWHESKEYLILR